MDELITAAQFDIVAFDEVQYGIARDAYRHYGKGRHPAGLNFGDCCSYALARARNDTLLFKGDDFSKSDIVPTQLVPAH